MSVEVAAAGAVACAGRDSILWCIRDPRVVLRTSCTCGLQRLGVKRFQFRRIEVSALMIAA